MMGGQDCEQQTWSTSLLQLKRQLSALRLLNPEPRFALFAVSTQFLAPFSSGTGFGFSLIQPF